MARLLKKTQLAILYFDSENFHWYKEKMSYRLREKFDQLKWTNTFVLPSCCVFKSFPNKAFFIFISFSVSHQFSFLLSPGHTTLRPPHHSPICVHWQPCGKLSPWPIWDAEKTLFSLGCLQLGNWAEINPSLSLSLAQANSFFKEKLF